MQKRQKSYRLDIRFHFWKTHHRDHWVSSWGLWSLAKGNFKMVRQRLRKLSGTAGYTEMTGAHLNFNLKIDFKIKKLPKRQRKWTNCSKESDKIKQVGSTNIQNHSYGCFVNTSLSSPEKVTDDWKHNLTTEQKDTQHGQLSLQGICDATI